MAGRQGLGRLFIYMSRATIALPARPVDLLYIKFRIEYLQVRLVTRIQDCGQCEYQPHM